jgi:hypothetical protein
MRVPELDDAESAEKKSGYESIEIVRVRFDAFETRVLDFKRPSTRVDRFHLASSININHLTLTWNKSTFVRKRERR